MVQIYKLAANATLLLEAGEWDAKAANSHTCSLSFFLSPTHTLTLTLTHSHVHTHSHKHTHKHSQVYKLAANATLLLEAGEWDANRITTRWSTRVSLGRILGCYVTKFAPHTALNVIA